MKLKDIIIKKLGGFTEEEAKIKIQESVREFKKQTFRKGDVVYTSSKNHFPHIPYYLIESYNNETCWIIGAEKDYKGRRHLYDGVHIGNLSHEPFKSCPHCSQFLESFKPLN